MLRIGFVVACLSLLSGCVSAAPKLRTVAVSAGEAEVEGQFQRQLVLEQRFLDNHRLETIRFRLGKAAVGFCPGKIKPEFGLAVANKHSFGHGDRHLATRAYGFGDRLRVLHVIKGTPAYNAGVRSGDYLLSVNGETIPSGQQAEAGYKSAADSGDRRMTLTVETPATSDARTGAGRKKMTLASVPVCKFDIELTESHKVGAYAMAGGITVTKGMLWFAQGDEIAFVVAHELIHVVRKHRRMMGKFGVQQKQVEAEADYLGLYVMARAGYEIGTASRFWRRIAAYFPNMRGTGRTHPTPSYRFVAMRKTIAEINAKIVAGNALVPGSAGRLADANSGG